MNDENQEINAKQSGLPIKRLAPIILLVIGLGAAFFYDLHHFFSFEMLKENRESLLSWAQNNHILSAIVFIAAYAAAIAVSLPGAIWLTILGGFMFGTLEGGILVVFAATLGATVIFLAARYAFADFVYEKAGPAIRRMEDGFRANAVSYMLVLRLVPLFPFWLVNLVPAFLGVSTRTYVISTLVGIVPGTFVYASLGNGIGHLIDAGQAPDLSIIFAPEVLGPLIGLAALSLVPVIYKRFKARDQAAG